MKPLIASAGVITPVKINARMIPTEMIENGIFPETNAMIVQSRMISVICKGDMIFPPYLFR